MANPWYGLYRILDTLDESELRAIRRRCEWCTALSPDKAKTNFAERIRTSAKDDADAGEITFEEVVKDIHNSIRKGPNQPSTRIRHVLEITAIAGDDVPREVNASRQLYGALRNEFGDNYRVYREHSVNGYRAKFDLFIENTETKECFLIECKIEDNMDKKDVIGQIIRYNDIVDNETELDRIKTFLLVFVKNENKHWYDMRHDPEFSIQDCIKLPDGLEEELEQEPRTKVIPRLLEEDIL